MDKNKLSALPDKPGVYIYKEASGKIIYIGKAKSLKKRVASYFNNTRKDIKTEKMVALISDMDFIVTKTEIEAFILENSLIKEHKPKYNILLKDDKSYPYIKITFGDPYPGVYVTRIIKEKKSHYFGPYYALEAKRVVQAIYRVFKVRQCTYDIKKPLKRPCVYYDTGVCTAPCTRFISDEAYAESIKEVRKFLNGSYKATIETLKKQMQEFSAAKKYEQAAEARDAILAVEEIQKQQAVITAEDRNIDVINSLYKNGRYYFCVLNVRSGRLISKKISSFAEMPQQENAMENFLLQYYATQTYFPTEAVLPVGSADLELLTAAVFKNKETKAVFKKRDALLAMALENIEEKVKQDEAGEKEKAVKDKEMLKQMESLKEALELEKLPRVIDGIDISHLHGENKVGSCVVFADGRPDKNNYRRYKIQTVTGIDDFASVAEVVTRRYSKMTEEELPGLIMIDGGIGQVNAAKEALEKLDVYPEVIGLAKREELVYRPYENKGIKLPAKAQFLLQRVRDEAHRFAVSYQFLLANKKMKETVFDNIASIGDKTQQMIYNEFRDKEELLAELEKDSDRVKFLKKKQKAELIKKLKNL
jgi:excinuclease ABC subunit C